jgi:uncharacterized protein YyaL (SSP411 family)
MNHLAAEKSPYLQQHANNPVDWYPWGDEAFGLARRDDKPIFLSIGYSTCHWCHVMEHESFEDPAIAEVLNRHFVSVKVDREERPDVDRVYMRFVQATTGSGGWPMSVFVTPGLQPFYGGTYLPPTSRWGRPGLREVLAEIIRVWAEHREQVLESAAALTDRLRSLGADPLPGLVPGPEALEAASRELAAVFDRRRGGFGAAPKFPRPSELLFLLRESARTGDAVPREMALATLGAMAKGGMRDPIGGGFHRYSVDADWRVPHFEKMLYDQAQLVVAYLEAAQVTHDAGYEDVANDTLRYVARDLSDADGGFFSAEDADSLPPDLGGDPNAHAREGAFYLWEDDEIARIAGADAALVRDRFGVRASGNAPIDPQQEFGTKNILYVARTEKELALAHGTTAEDVAQRLERARSALFNARAVRPRPRLDNKVLAGWNGLMIAAFARGARVLQSDAHLERAERAADFVSSRMWNAGSRTLTHRYCGGEAAIEAFAEGYACLAFGLLELFQASGKARWLAWAIEAQDRLDELFWDQTGAGWFSTTGEDSSVLLRLKEDYDGAEPSASSVAVANLLTLLHLTGDARWEARIDATLGAQASRLAHASRGVPMMLANLSAYHHGLHQIVILGRRQDEATRAMERVLARTYLPFAVSVTVEPGDHQREVARLMPSVGALRAHSDRPTAFVCRRFVCEQPTTDLQEFEGQVKGLQQARSR